MNYLKLTKQEIYKWVWVFCLHEFKCTMYMANAQQGQKRVMDPLELNLQVVVSYHGVLGT